MKFVLEKHIPPEEGIEGWYYEGTYSEKNVNALVRCAFEFGNSKCIYDDVRVRVELE